jgi:putative DNA primase/helicase
MSESATCAYCKGAQLPKPDALPVQFESIPQTLRDIPQWVCWRYEERGGKWTKPPCKPDKTYAKWTDPQELSTFEEVRGAYDEGGFDGVGIVLTANMGIVGIDLDHMTKDEAQIYFDSIGDTYIEESPSGNGFRIFAKGSLPKDGKRNDKFGIEIYNNSRYLTITGHKINDYDITDQQSAINGIYNYVANEKVTEEKEEIPGLADITDPAKREEMCGADCGDRLDKLFKTDEIFTGKFLTPAPVGERSTHEFYLAAYLLEHGFNPAETWIIMDESSQTKWLSRDNNYKNTTIKNAMGRIESDNHYREEHITYDDVMVETDKGDKFSPTKAAEAAIAKHGIIATTNHNTVYWIYDCEKGIYQPNGEHIILSEMDRAAKDACTTTAKANTLSKISSFSPGNISDFDKDPYMLCVKNGVVDLRTGQFYNHNKKYKMTIQINADYNPNATCPTIDKFLDDIMEHSDDKNTIYDIIASLCIKTPFDAIIALIGSGANGKGVLIKLISEFIGAGNITNVRLDSLDRPFSVYEMFRKMAVINSEVEDKASTFKIMKAIVTGEPMDGEIKYGPHIRFSPFGKIIFDTNNPPQINDSSYGMARRLIKLDFKQRFTDIPNLVTGEKRRDPGLLEKLITEEERSGLLNIIIAIAPRLIKTKKIGRYKSPEEMAGEYDRQSHSISGFVEEHCDITGIQDHFTPFKDLYDAYKKYCIKINTSPKSERALSTYLKKEIGLNKIRNGPDRIRGYVGVKLYT